MNPSKYVLLDLETNGTKSGEDDLLSISLYKPDTGEHYDRFLPLEINKHVETTVFNGITDEDLKDSAPLSQEEFDRVAEEYGLYTRTILTYGSIDERFLTKYLLRKKIAFDKMNFFNFKTLVLSDPFSSYAASKDGLCISFGIDGVNLVHSGHDDCELEWKLFQKMGNKHIFVDKYVYEIEQEHCFHSALFGKYPSMKRWINNYPKGRIETELIRSFSAEGKRYHEFGLKGILAKMLNCKNCYDEEFIRKNDQYVKCGSVIGVPKEEGESCCYGFPRYACLSPLSFKVHISREKEVRDSLKELVEYLKKSILTDSTVMANETVIDREHRIMMVHDYSDSKSIVKYCTEHVIGREETAKFATEIMLAGNRDYYHIVEDMSKFYLFRDRLIQESDEECTDKLSLFAASMDDETVYPTYCSGNTVVLHCTVCGHNWITTPPKARKQNACIFCHEKKPSKKDTEEGDPVQRRFNKQVTKISELSNGKVELINYPGSREDSEFQCRLCSHKWKGRIDHFSRSPRCPNCKSVK